MTQVTNKRVLTGRKVALMFCAAFGTIITANLVLVYSAVGSFPGLETRAPYIESLSFEARRSAQERLNWHSKVAYADGTIILTLKEQGGATVVTPHISLIVGRATSSHLDKEVPLNFDGQQYIGKIDIVAGNWQAKVKATALDGTLFSRTLSLYIKVES